MKKIIKKDFEKHFRDVYKETHEKKTLGEEIEEYVRSIAIKELEAHGDDGMEKIVIDNVSIEILSEAPEGEASIAKHAVTASAGLFGWGRRQGAGLYIAGHGEPNRRETI